MELNLAANSRSRDVARITIFFILMLGPSSHTFCQAYGSEMTLVKGLSHWVEWKRDKQLNGVTDVALESVWISRDGSKAFAVGEVRGVLVYDEEDDASWSIDPSTESLDVYPLHVITMNPEGTTGWAAGAKDFLRYIGGEWEVVGRGSYYHVRDIWISDDGESGWAVGDDGLIMRYAYGEWNTFPEPEEIVEGLPNGDEVVRRVESIRYTDKSLDSVSFSPDGQIGFACSRYGALLRFENDEWSVEVDGDLGNDGQEIRFKAIERVPANGAFYLIHDDGHIRKFEDGVWKAVEQSLDTDTSLINDIWISRDGESGWAAGYAGRILRLSESTWSIHAKPVNAYSGIMSSIAFSEEMGQGFAVSLNGDLATYRRDEDAWSLDERVSGFTTDNLNDVWIDQSGESGWACGQNGQILRLTDGQRWQVFWEPEQLNSGVLSSLRYGWSANKLWFNKGESIGWALGDNHAGLRFTRDTSGEWQIDPVPLDGVHHIEDMWLHEDGQEGWAVCQSGQFVRYQNSRWEPWGTDLDIESTYLVRVDMSADGTKGWAVGRRGQFFEYLGEWTRGPTLGDLSSAGSSSDGNVEVWDLWVNDNGDYGWAVGSRIWRLENEVWSAWRHPNEFVHQRLMCIWMDDSGENGVAVGASGEILTYGNGTWQHANFEPLEYLDLKSVSGDHNMRHIWAVGERGVMLHTEVFDLPIPVIHHNDEHLISPMGSKFTVDFGSVPILTAEVSLNVRDADIAIANRVEMDIDRETNIAAVDLASANQFLRPGEDISLVLDVTYPGIEPPVERTYGYSFKAPGTIWWLYPVALVVSILLCNLLLLLLAIPFPSVRWLVLDPRGSQLIGLVFAKYLVTDLLIFLVNPIRLGLFRDYRKTIRALEFSGDSLHYVPQTLSFDQSGGSSIIMLDHAEALKHIEASGKRRVWLVQGESGLGKTSLVEHWAELLAAEGETPILIRLGERTDLQTTLTNILRNYGDLDTTASKATALIALGGFVIILDGFDEDLDPAATEEFVSRVCRKNTVILTSQIAPQWTTVNLQRVRLHEFGTDELLEMMDEQWVTALQESEIWQELARLPFTATILSEFINRNQRLPMLRIDIYEDLWHQLRVAAVQEGSEGCVSNLEAKAWSMFCDGSMSFSPTPQVPESFCRVAASAGVLKRRIERDEQVYRWRHNLISRFVIACFFDTAKYRPIMEWSEELNRSGRPTDWFDIAEFWSEFYVRDLVNGNRTIEQLHRFLSDIEQFDPEAFRRAYGVLVRLRDAGDVDIPEEIRTWAESKIVRSHQVRFS